MAEPRFTPGPWSWLNYPDGRKLLYADNKAVIHCADAPITIDEADQGLIATAPEMYAFIRRHADNSECSCSDWMNTPKDGKCDHCEAVALIDKATKGA